MGEPLHLFLLESLLERGEEGWESFAGTWPHSPVTLKSLVSGPPPRTPPRRQAGRVKTLTKEKVFRDDASLGQEYRIKALKPPPSGHSTKGGTCDKTFLETRGWRWEGPHARPFVGRHPLRLREEL